MYFYINDQNYLKNIILSKTALLKTQILINNNFFVTIQIHQLLFLFHALSYNFSLVLNYF